MPCWVLKKRRGCYEARRGEQMHEYENANMPSESRPHDSRPHERMPHESVPMRMVVKIAGALLDDADAVRSLARQIAQLAHQGHELLGVHGGGKIFTARLA